MSKYIGGMPTHSKNPFTDCKFKVQTARKKKYLKSRDNYEIADIATGELIETQFITKQLIDAEEFIKIFSTYSAILWGLTSPGAKLLSLILQTVQKEKNKDTILLDCVSCNKWNTDNPSKKISPTTFSRGKKNLLDCGIIAYSTRYFEFFINPRILFNGDRLAITTIYEQNKSNTKY
jgi:hypothetical protein